MVKLPDVAVQSLTGVAVVDASHCQCLFGYDRNNMDARLGRGKNEHISAGPLGPVILESHSGKLCHPVVPVASRELRWGSGSMCQDGSPWMVLVTSEPV